MTAEPPLYGVVNARNCGMTARDGVRLATERVENQAKVQAQNERVQAELKG